ncbi:unnamed protein product [Leptidea sinapis]|uniref:Uncharacterized protein n=1 Tax=Leptidea sinapis TaxID=189913 RepID=A0A5E4Q943_9NEOP|nr:unnamed protein product [Leptidea sinapis]
MSGEFALASKYENVIAAEPFLRPLLKLLSQLVTVLNQLCVALMQNMKFVDLFFLMTHTQNGSQPEVRAAPWLATPSCSVPRCRRGLSGLYSLLPRSLDENVHRLTPDDVNRVNKLTLFIDSLEFCNAVAQVAHPSIRRHLLDLLYQGFLVPVLGPALLQTKGGSLQSGRGEQAAATAYCELVLRCATPDGLLRQVLRYLLTFRSSRCP